VPGVQRGGEAEMTALELQVAIQQLGPEMAAAMGYVAELERVSRREFEAIFDAAEYHDGKGGYAHMMQIRWAAFKAARGLK